MKYVLAGNYDQYMNWCRDTGTHSILGAHYIGNRSLSGVRFPITDFVKVGTWRQRNDLDELRRYISAAVYPSTLRCPLFETITKTPLFDPEDEKVQPEWMVRAAAVTPYPTSTSFPLDF